MILHVVVEVDYYAEGIHRNMALVIAQPHLGTLGLWTNREGVTFVSRGTKKTLAETYCAIAKKIEADYRPPRE